MWSPVNSFQNAVMELTIGTILLPLTSESYLRDSTLVAVVILGRDGNSAFSTQRAVHQLLEIRPVPLAEPEGDHEGMVIGVLPVQIVALMHAH